MTPVPGFLQRLKRVLPPGWFGDVTPNLDVLLTAIATPFEFILGLQDFVRVQARISTCENEWLDGASTDFFGQSLPRIFSESDSAYRLRVLSALLGPCATRSALDRVILIITGKQGHIFEPNRPQDTGVYCGSTIGYGVAGGWGNLHLPFQLFIDLTAPSAGGLGNLAGYSSGGELIYTDASLLPGLISQQDIYAAIVHTLPIGTTAWIRFL